MISKKKCVPCQGGIPPLNKDQVRLFIKELDGGWEISKNRKIKKEFQFNEYSDAILFTNKVAELSEKEGHHPYIHINYKQVVIILFTHKINGLHENDFILASKCDTIFKLTANI